MNLITHYSAAVDKVILKFLDAIIKANERMQQEFINFATPGDENISSMAYDDFLKIVKTTRQEFPVSKPKAGY